MTHDDEYAFDCRSRSQLQFGRASSIHRGAEFPPLTIARCIAERIRAPMVIPAKEVTIGYQV